MFKLDRDRLENADVAGVVQFLFLQRVSGQVGDDIRALLVSVVRNEVVAELNDLVENGRVTIQFFGKLEQRHR